MIHIAPSIAEALSSRRPVVALETAVIAHGLPPPINLEVATRAEEIIHAQGAVAATVGIVAGRPTVGLTREEIEAFAKREGIVKTNLSNFAWAVTRQAWGATTVSASLKLAERAGIKVFATGGIGGVHRDAAQTWDVSSDLTVLADTPMLVVCAGVKSILDVPKTIEHLETLGVPVIGYETRSWPAFFTRNTGIKLEVTTSSPEEVVSIAQAHWSAGNTTAVLLAVPVPEEAEVPHSQVEAALTQALAEADRLRISGKAITPFLLSQMETLTAGRSLKANVALLLNNADVAAKVSCAMARTTDPLME
jgi:pseudouridine-5'-phosphate glycosidase